MSTSNGFDASTWEPRIHDARLTRREVKSTVAEEEAAQWAALLTQALPPSPNTLAPPVFRAQAAPADSPLPAENACSVSPGTILESQRADTTGVNDTRDQRVILNVDSETLGRVQLVVDRDEDGLRILVGSESDAKSTLSGGKHSLSEALSAAGVRVQSLRFVAREEVGTVLAQDRLSKRARIGSKADTQPEDEAEAQLRSKRKRKINLVG